jgi:DNA-binding NtrC family response regulator
MVRVREIARKVARVHASVLIQGETGTGKSLLARIIHNESPRAGGSFVAVNCAGVPESLFEAEFFGHRKGAFTGAVAGRKGFLEMAHGGSLFLDEVGELPVSQQAKLLTALEEGEIRRLGSEATVRVAVRVLTAASTHLAEEVEAGRFRRDLFHRLAVLTLQVPPLRDRPEDIEVLARWFLESHQRRHGFPMRGLPNESLGFLESRSWPGNVRELSHFLEAALILSGGARLGPSVLRSVREPTPRDPARPRKNSGPERVLGSGWRGITGDSPGSTRYSFGGTAAEERELIGRTLQDCRGNRTLTAKRLGMARSTLRSKLKSYDLETRGDRRQGDG